MKNAPGVQPVQLFVKNDTILSPIAGFDLSAAQQVAAGVGAPTVIYGYDPTAALLQRVTAAKFNADALVTTDYAGLSVAAFGYGYNGATLDRLRTASATNQNPALTAHPGVQMTTRIGDWSLSSVAGINAQATLSKPAVAGARHVCTSLAAVVMMNAALAAFTTTPVRLRDGASGGGTILWGVEAGMATAQITPYTLFMSGLNIVGSVNTIMTWEFSAALGANTIESLSITGYTIT